MNILKLAKNLKEFTLDEIEMLAEMDCKTAIKQLLNERKIEFENEKYFYVEKQILDFDIFSNFQSNCQYLTLETATKNFMINYAEKNCKPESVRKYRAIFKYDIIPFFYNKSLDDINIEDIRIFYLKCKELNFKPLRIKNTLALLKQLIKYFQNQGVIDRKCIFQVKRLTDKTKFSVDRIIFDKERS